LRRYHLGEFRGGNTNRLKQMSGFADVTVRASSVLFSASLEKNYNSLLFGSFLRVDIGKKTPPICRLAF
jgi:hypothetical protein